MIKKILFIVVAICCSMSVNAITVDEFFESLKAVDAAEYEKVPTMIGSMVNEHIKSVETIGIVPVDEEQRIRLLSLCDSVDETEDVTLVKDNKENEQFRTWMQVEGEIFTVVMFSLMCKDDVYECQVVKVIADKEALNDEKFIQFKKQE